MVQAMSEGDDRFREALSVMAKGAIAQMKGEVPFLPIVTGAIAHGRTDCAVKWSSMSTIVLVIANIFSMQDIPCGDGPNRSNWVEGVLAKMDEFEVFKDAPDYARESFKSVLNMATNGFQQAGMAIHYDDMMALGLDGQGCGDEDCKVCQMLVRHNPPEGQLLS